MAQAFSICALAHHFTMVDYLTYFLVLVIVYDVTRRETFTNLSDVWAKEVKLYSTNQDCVKMLVGNKVDRDSERAVSKEKGIALAKELGSMFHEYSAKRRENVEQCFEELALKVHFYDDNFALHLSSNIHNILLLAAGSIQNYL
ncbi:hypothetical protein REPUB_Repub19eG0130200 [Reevesia pubescens]